MIKGLCVMVAVLAAAANGLWAQAPAGIHFEDGLSWAQIQAKARAEHKFIFMDAYTTWCVPCKDMDEEVYPLAQVGSYMNAHYISVKVQWDQTPQDTGAAVSWRPEVKAFDQKYKLTGFPTFFFFDANGRALHQAMGVQSPQQFLTLARNAADPQQQYFTLRDQYAAGQRNVTNMATLAVAAHAVGDTAVSNEVTRDLRENYLANLADSQVYTKPMLEFLRLTMTSSKDRAFSIFYWHSDQVDAILGQVGAAQDATDLVIINEDILPQLAGKDAKPDWGAIRVAIGRKYDAADALRTVLVTQIWWYTQRHDYPMMIRYNLEKMDRYGVDTSGSGPYKVNKMVWEVMFEHATDTLVLQEAVGWMDMVVQAVPTNGAILDTHANLLYKMGHASDAIAEETRAVALSHNDPAIEANLAKMEKGVPTWDTDSSATATAASH